MPAGVEAMSTQRQMIRSVSSRRLKPIALSAGQNRHHAIVNAIALSLVGAIAALWIVSLPILTGYVLNQMHVPL
jgi:hypothetical protein